MKLRPLALEGGYSEISRCASSLVEALSDLQRMAMEENVADAKKPWSKPVITRLSLSEEELATSFPNLGEKERKSLLEKAGNSSGVPGKT